MNLALYQPDIPQNTGSIMRLCACLDVTLHIIEPCGFVLDEKSLKRVAMDYAAQARCIRHSSWEHFLDFNSGQTGKLLLLTTKSAHAYTDYAYSPEDTLLLGRESAGVPQDVHHRADAQLTIPMHKNARSLNVALAAAMVLSEALRQTRGFPA